MPSAIRTPETLGIPMRNGFGDTYEENRTLFNPEIGASRRRRVMRTSPRLFDVSWTFSQDQFTTFDKWWQEDIKGGIELFDIQLMDDDASVVWFTVRAIGEYSSEVSQTNVWTVRLRIRAMDLHFGSYRDPGTDNIRGMTSIGVSASGALQVDRVLRGASTIGISSATLRPKTLPLYGSTSIGMYSLPKGQLSGVFYGSASIGLNPLPKGQLAGVFYGATSIGLSSATIVV